MSIAGPSMVALTQEQASIRLPDSAYYMNLFGDPRLDRDVDGPKDDYEKRLADVWWT